MCQMSLFVGVLTSGFVAGAVKDSLENGWTVAFTKSAFERLKEVGQCIDLW